MTSPEGRSKIRISSLNEQSDDTSFGIGAGNKEYCNDVPNACLCKRKNSVEGLSIFWYLLLTVTTYKNLPSFFPFSRIYMMRG